MRITFSRVPHSLSSLPLKPHDKKYFVVFPIFCAFSVKRIILFGFRAKFQEFWTTISKFVLVLKLARLSRNNSAKTITQQNVNKQNSTRLRSCQHLPEGLRPRSLPAISCSRYSNLLDILCCARSWLLVPFRPLRLPLVSSPTHLFYVLKVQTLSYVYLSHECWAIHRFSILKKQTVIGQI